jgi:hypothetical protein
LSAIIVKAFAKATAILPRHHVGGALVSRFFQRVGRETKALPTFQKFSDRGHDFLNVDRLHTSEVYRTFTQETGAALDVMPQDDVAISQRARQLWFGRTEDGDSGQAEQGSEVHRAGIIGQK